MTDHGKQTMAFPIKLAAETRAGENSRVVEGHAVMFNSRSLPIAGAFVEEIAPGALAGPLARRRDQFLLLGHDHGDILARRDAGTLTLTEDSTGLKFRAEMVNTTLGRDTAELVRTGHLTGMSFGFTMEGGRDEWTRTRDGERQRRILEVGQLLEVSLVTFPAYPEADDVSEGREADRELALRGARAKRGRPPRITRGDEPYAPGSGHSFFRDQAIVGLSDERGKNNTGWRFGQDTANVIPSPGAPSVDEARGRLKAARALWEARIVNTGAGAGGELLPAGMPPELADAFTTAARAQGVLPEILGVAGPLPQGAGMVEKIPGFSAGVSVAVQSAEGAAATEGSPTTGYQSGEVATLTGTILVSRQVMDLSSAEPGFDVEMAAELGAALATARDSQILTGSGSSHEMQGLLTASGITSTTYTDATPTTRKLFREGIAANWSAVAKALGKLPDTILMSPTRYAWLFSGYDTTNARPIQSDLLSAFCEPDQVPGMPLKQGANTNEEPIVILNRDSVRLYLNEPQLIATREPKSANGEVRFTIYQLGALVVRKAVGVGVTLGTGLKEAPAFT